MKINLFSDVFWTNVDGKHMDHVFMGNANSTNIV
jgi:hypothetical protein